MVRFRVRLQDQAKNFLQCMNIEKGIARVLAKITGSMKWPSTKVHKWPSTKVHKPMLRQRLNAMSKVPKSRPSRNIELKVGKSQIKVEVWLNYKFGVFKQSQTQKTMAVEAGVAQNKGW